MSKFSLARNKKKIWVSAVVVLAFCGLVIYLIYSYFVYRNVKDSLALRAGINAYYQGTSIGNTPNCSGVQNGDYQIEGPFYLGLSTDTDDLSFNANQDYLVQVSRYCGKSLNSDNGNGNFLIFEDVDSNFKNIGVLDGLVGWNNVLIQTSTKYGYQNIITLDAGDKEIHLWQWDDTKSMYKENTYSNYIVADGSVYYNGKIIPNADAASFTIFNYDWAKDKDHVYYDGGVDDDFDTATFVVFRDPDATDDIEFVADKSGIYYQGNPGDYTPPKGYILEGADLATFEDIGFDYAKDKNHVYGGSDLLEGRDPATFSILSDPDNSGVYTKDKNGVYFYDRPVVGADPYTFHAIAFDFGADDANLFYEGLKQNPTDIATIKILNMEYPVYIKDANRVYTDIDNQDASSVIVGADPTTFSLIPGGYPALEYSKDATHVFWHRNIVPGADPSTFVFLGESGLDIVYGKDKNSVFRDGDVIPNADPATFVVP